MTLHFNCHPRWHLGNNQSVRSSPLMVSRWLWPWNRTFLEMASMVTLVIGGYLVDSGYFAQCILLLFVSQAIDDPSSNQFRDSPTYTHQPSMQQKVPFSLIRCSSSKVAFCSCVEWGWHIYNIVESESDPLTRRAVDLFEKEPLKGNSEVHLHTPTKFGEDRSKDLGGDREQTDRQTNRQTLLDL